MALNHLSQLLNQLHKRPLMYFGQRSLIRMAAFIRGYFYAHLGTAIGEEYDYMNQFTDFLRERYEVTLSLGWDGILLSVAQDNEVAFDLFWQQWEEFTTNRD